MTRGATWKRIDLPTSLFLMLPLFLLYQVGVLAVPAGSGADLVTGLLLALVGGNRWKYLAALTVIAVALAMTAWLANRRRPMPTHLFAPLLLESAIYALTMGTLIVFVMQKVLHIDPRLAIRALAEPVVISLGAGFHEELVFRQLLLPALALAFHRGGAGPRSAAMMAALISSLLFAAAHHLGPMGDPWQVGAVVYRTLAGLFFAALYTWRGLGVAAWTHAFYDLYVLVVLG